MPTTRTGSEALLGFLREAKKQADAEKPDDIRVEWQRALEQLFDVLEKHLRRAVEAKLLTVKRDSTAVLEPRLGQYDVPRLTISAPNGREVRVLPCARYVVGAKGRVDVGSGPKTALLLWTDSGWQLANREGGRGAPPPVPLTEESFSEALLNLLS